MLLLSNRKFIIIIITALLVTGSGIVTQDLFAKTTFSKSLDVSSNIAVPEGLTFSPDGKKCTLPIILEI